MTLLTLNPIKTVLDQLDRLAAWGWDIPLRLFLAWEFFESGLEKWHGDNWFEQIHAASPSPSTTSPPASTGRYRCGPN